MFDKFISWCRYYDPEITWFLVGFLTSSGISDLAKGELGSAGLSFGLALVNYLLYKKR
jgi:hypothetical protein